MRFKFIPLEATMTFLISTPTTSPDSQTYERALEEWRRQAQLVAELWENFLAARGRGRSPAFGAYVAALDAEEAAAIELAAFSLAKAA
jgi:hypothetical protein